MKRFAIVLAMIASATACALGAGCGGETSGACEGNVRGPECSCEAERRLRDGTCCAGWQRARGAACVARMLETPPVLRALGANGASAPVLSIDERGELVVAWTTTIDNVVRLFVGETDANLTSIAVREPANALEGRSLQPAVTGGLGRRMTVAWKQERTSDDARIFVSERDDAGMWADPKRLEDAFSFAPRAFEPALLTTTRGETLLVWNQWFDKFYGAQIARRLPGAAWERPNASNAVVSFPYFYVNAPRLAASPTGDVLVSWYQAAPDEKLMAFYSERRGESGTFSKSTGRDYVSAGGGDVGGQGGGSPKAALSPAGHGAIAWAQEDDGKRKALYVATRDAQAADWQRPRSLADNLGPQAGNVDLVQVAYGSRGTLWIVWTQVEGESARVYALRRNADGSWRDPPDRPLLLSASDRRGQAVAIASGRDGAIAIAWIELDASGSALRLMRAWDGDETRTVETLATSEKHADAPALAFGGNPERLAIAWTEGVQSHVNLAVIR